MYRKIGLLVEFIINYNNDNNNNYSNNNNNSNNNIAVIVLYQSAFEENLRFEFTLYSVTCP